MSKFANIPTTVNGISFHSKLEANRYTELLILQKAGDISNLETQTLFRLDVDGLHICKYYADFTYLDRNGRYIVEDTKGVITPEFRLKKKLMLAIHKIDIQLVFAKKNRITGRRTRVTKRK